MSEWKEYKLGELVALNERSIGRNFKFERIEYIDTSSVTENKFETPVLTTLEDAPSRAKRLISDGDTIISTVRPIQKHYGFIKKAKDYQVVSTGFVVVTPKKIEPRFLYYFLTQVEVTEYLNTIAEGGTTTFPAFKSDELKDLPINLPDLPTQTAIAEILSSLDDKIELNNKINKELENLAQTLFKRWFIDFEFPNENGEPYKSSGGEMVESELGEIPKGWEVEQLCNLLTVKYGKDHKHLSDGIYPLYGSGGIMRYVEIPLFKQNSILIPRKGTLSNLFYLEEPFWSVDTMFYTEIHNPIYGRYLFHCIKALDIASMNVGSAVPSMTTKVLNELKVLKPNNLLMQEFDNVLGAFYNSINQNKNEIKDLTNLRDTLLPKLISGELEVNNINF
jgi:type I restriction enzyme S subunit